MSPKKESKKKVTKASPKEEKLKTLEITLTSEIRRALELIRLPDETDEAAIARALHESFEYSLIRNVIAQIDERLEGIISSKVEEEIVETEEEVEAEIVVPAEVNVPSQDGSTSSIPPADANNESDVDDLDDAITEEVENQVIEFEEPEIPPMLSEASTPIPEPKQEPAPEPPVPIRPPAMSSKADVHEPKPEVKLMKRNLEKKWLRMGDGL